MKPILTTLSQKWPEYLLEILVITIGILGAFALNNWNEERKAKQEERVLLQQLLSEYQSNLAQLQSKIDTRTALVQSSTELLQYFDDPEGATLDDLLPGIANLGLTVTYDPIQNNLFASGNINKISSAKLKALLTSWSTDVIQVQEVETIYLNTFNTEISPYINEIGISRPVHEYFWESIQKLDFMLAQNEIKSYGKSNSRFLPTAEELLNDAKLEGYVSYSIMISDFINLEAQTLEKQINEIITLLKEEIK